MSDFLEKMNKEIDRRIAIMKDAKYENVPPFEKKDYWPPVILFVVYTVILIISYFNV